MLWWNLRLLNSKNREHRLRAVKRLARSKSDKAADALLKASRWVRDIEVLSRIFDALAATDSGRARVREALSDKEPEIRLEAASAIERAGMQGLDASEKAAVAVAGQKWDALRGQQAVDAIARLLEMKPSLKGHAEPIANALQRIGTPDAFAVALNIPGKAWENADQKNRLLAAFYEQIPDPRMLLKHAGPGHALVLACLLPRPMQDAVIEEVWRTEEGRAAAARLSALRPLPTELLRRLLTLRLNACPALKESDQPFGKMKQGALKALKERGWEAQTDEERAWAAASAGQWDQLSESGAAGQGAIAYLLSGKHGEELVKTLAGLGPAADAYYAAMLDDDHLRGQYPVAELCELYRTLKHDALLTVITRKVREAPDWWRPLKDVLTLGDALRHEALAQAIMDTAPWDKAVAEIYGERLLPRLRDHLADRSNPRFSNCVEALEKIGTPQAVGIIAAHFPRNARNLPPEDLRQIRRIVEALGRCATPGELSLLVDTAVDQSHSLRFAAMQALLDLRAVSDANLQDSDIQKLRSYWASESDPFYAREAAAVLAGRYVRLGRIAALQDLLERSFRSKDGNVRETLYGDWRELMKRLQESIDPASEAMGVLLRFLVEKRGRPMELAETTAAILRKDSQARLNSENAALIGQLEDQYAYEWSETELRTDTGLDRDEYPVAVKRSRVFDLSDIKALTKSPAQPPLTGPNQSSG